MTRDELEAVIFEHADPRNILRGKLDGRAIRAALDEFAREQRAEALREAGNDMPARDGGLIWADWLRRRADRIEKGND